MFLETARWSKVFMHGQLVHGVVFAPLEGSLVNCRFIRPESTPVCELHVICDEHQKTDFL